MIRHEWDNSPGPLQVPIDRRHCPTLLLYARISRSVLFALGSASEVHVVKSYYSNPLVRTYTERAPLTSLDWAYRGNLLFVGSSILRRSELRQE